MKIRITKKGLPKAQFGFPDLFGKNPVTYDEKTGMINTNNSVVTKQDTRDLGFSDSGVYIKDAAKNLQNIFQTGSAKDIKQGISNFNSDYGTNLKDPRFFKFGNNAQNAFNKMADLGATAQIGITALSGITGAIDDAKKKKEFDQYMRNQQVSANLFPTVTTEDRGDYVSTGTSFGMFRPDQMVVNKGMYTGQFLPTAQGGGFASVIPDMLSSSYTSLAGSLPTSGYVPSSSSSRSANVTAAPEASVNVGKGYSGRLAHNNPGNIHIGNFAKKYGAVAGRPDAGGKVAIFPDMQSGIQAMQDLLFSGSYTGLNAKQARRKWVGFPSESEDVLLKMFGNRKLSDFSPSERSTLMNEFIKYEDRDVYNHLKNNRMIYQHGGESNTEDIMKIKITGTPSMEYGGQNNYGLDLGRKKVYTDMTDNPFESSGRTMSEEENPDSPYVLEAEGGETVVRPDGTHFNISGPSHAQGGVKLTEQQVPADSFIYSKTKKLSIKDPEVLKYFGKSYKKGGVVPADIAKQYDLNKYKAIMDDPYADKIAKTTASMMLNNYNKKLGGLALVQEGMKGFPNGIPNVASSVLPEAAYGGFLPKYQTKGEVIPTRKAKTKQEFEAAKASGEWKPVEGMPGYLEKVTKTKIKEGTPGSPGTKTVVETPETRGAIPGGKPGKPWEDFIKGELKRGVTIDELVKKGHGTKEGLKQFELWYVPAEKQVKVTDPIPPTDPEYREDRERMYFEEKPIPTVPEIGITPIKPMSPGRRPSFASQFAIQPKRYTPYAAPMAVVTPEPTFFDPNRQLAANAEQMNIMSQGLSSMGSPQSYLANMSSVQGKAFENAANIMSDTQNKNVGVANTFSPLQANILNQAAAYNADRIDKLAYNANMYDRDYRNAMATYLRNYDAYRGNEYKMNTYENMMNQVNPFFQYINTPKGGKMVMAPGVDAMSMITGNFPGTQQQTQGMSPTAYLQAVENFKSKYPNASPTQIDRAIQLQNPGMMGARSSGNQRAMANFINMALNNVGRNPQDQVDMSDLYDENQ